MRLFEISLALVNLAFLVTQRARPGSLNRPLVVLLSLNIVFLTLHLVIEKSRWQMIPLYLLSLAVLLLGLAQLARPFSLPTPVILVWGGLLLASSLLPALVPVPRLPEPGGPYQVGTQTFDWVDEQRVEIYPPGQGRKRHILVQVWYPAEPDSGASLAPYLRDLDRLAPAIARSQELPGFTLNHLRLARTHAYEKAPALNNGQTFPVLVFSHGWNGMRAQNTYQAEMLASHGYVVFSADHTYGASAVAFPDGELALNYSQALPEGVSDEVYDQEARKLGQLWVGDIHFVIDQSFRLNSGELESPLVGRLNLEQIGVFGHSTGGGAALEAAWTDPRIQAGLTMDAWMIPYSRQMPAEGLSQSFLFLESQYWNARRNPALVKELQAHMRGESQRVVLKGANHYSFTDMGFFMPLINRVLSRVWWGPTHQEQVNRATLDFFNRYFTPPVAQPEWETNPVQATAGRRIVIVGVTGSGKTTTAMQLASILEIPHIELDSLHWLPGWQMAERESFRQAVQQALSGADWVTDGNYRKARDLIWGRADTLVWLDYPLSVTLWQLTKRTLTRVITRQVLWNGNRETARGAFFSRDSLFLWALQSYPRQRAEYPRILAGPAYRHLKVIRLRNRSETMQWLRQQAEQARLRPAAG